MAIQTNPIYPNRSPLLIALSNVYTAFALWVAALITLAIITVFMLKSQIWGASFIYPFFLVLGGYVQSIWTYLYPQINLGKIVSLGKKHTLNQIENEIEKLYNQLDKFKKTDFEHFENLMSLHEQIKNRPNSVNETSLPKSYISSLLVPILVTIIGSIDWNKILSIVLDLIRRQS